VRVRRVAGPGCAEGGHRGGAGSPAGSARRPPRPVLHAANRCTRDTGECLVELGFTLLSREHRAEPLGLLPELPVHLDVARLSPEELDTRFAGHMADGGPIGVMLHHAVMEPEDMARLDHLLGLLAGHENVIACRMAELAC
jgi:hypothetical protein